ncbi:Transposase domain [Natronobacterium texcoconense]|uniref:Transposase domain n=1 Tax=Natronobacterium texcoconense TaxID=1095778 RepID=A0A1H1F201_NATTX|nr:Transposase domain [Natronobacterium texcoconense]
MILSESRKVWVMTNGFPEQNASLSTESISNDTDSWEERNRNLLVSIEIENVSRKPGENPYDCFYSADPADPKHSTHQAALITSHEIIDDLNDDIDVANAVTNANIRLEKFTDPYWDDRPEIYEFEVMLRSFIYAELRGIRYHQDLADFLERNPAIAFTLGFEPDLGDENEYLALQVYHTPETPHQTTITRCANRRFLARTEKFIMDVADEIEAYCR